MRLVQFMALQAMAFVVCGYMLWHAAGAVSTVKEMWPSLSTRWRVLFAVLLMLLVVVAMAPAFVDGWLMGWNEGRGGMP